MALVNRYLAFRHWYNCLSHMELTSMAGTYLLLQLMDLVVLDGITHRLLKTELAHREVLSATSPSI